MDLAAWPPLRHAALLHGSAPAPTLPLSRCRLDRPLLCAAPSIGRHVAFRPAVAPHLVARPRLFYSTSGCATAARLLAGPAPFLALPRSSCCLDRWLRHSSQRRRSPPRRPAKASPLNGVDRPPTRAAADPPIELRSASVRRRLPVRAGRLSAPAESPCAPANWRPVVCWKTIQGNEGRFFFFFRIAPNTLYRSFNNPSTNDFFGSIFRGFVALGPSPEPRTGILHWAVRTRRRRPSGLRTRRRFELLRRFYLTNAKALIRNIDEGSMVAPEVAPIHMPISAAAPKEAWAQETRRRRAFRSKAPRCHWRRCASAQPRSRGCSRCRSGSRR